MKAFVVATIAIASVASVLGSPYYPALQVYANGAVAPVETPEVQAEKAKHFAAHAERGYGYAAVPAWGGYAAPAHGIPADTPEVAHAKAAHFAAVAQAKAKIAAAGPSGPSVWAGDYAGPSAYHGPIHIPHIVNGVPVEPAEVQHARAAHLAAVAKAHSGPAAYYGGEYDDGSYKGSY